ncbi:hypothetical protein C8Q80DRAFT_1197814 [Daedaleopsis nitida]|nr:hypothetical protein C8Q80DRAFT_1197814 [Daedaleopsis nitida]
MLRLLMEPGPQSQSYVQSSVSPTPVMAFEALNLELLWLIACSGIANTTRSCGSPVVSGPAQTHAGTPVSALVSLIDLEERREHVGRGRTPGLLEVDHTHTLYATAIALAVLLTRAMSSSPGSRTSPRAGSVGCTMNHVCSCLPSQFDSPASVHERPNSQSTRQHTWPPVRARHQCPGCGWTLKI